MRKLRFLALLAPVLVLPVVACDDEFPLSNANFTPAPVPPFEGGVAPIVEGGVPAEAGLDAGPDVVGPVLPVTVTVIDSGLPKSAVRVLFHDATGAVTGDVMTDATGKVSVAVAPSMVTVLTNDASNSTSVAPVTFMGVAAGDNLVIAIPTPYNSGAAGGSYSVPLTAGTYTNTANSFYASLNDRCGNSAGAVGTIGITAYPHCVGALNAILVSASYFNDDNEGNITNDLIGFGFAKGLAKPAAQATVNVPAITFAAPGTTKLTASNLPVGTNFEVTLFSIAGGESFYADRSTGSIDANGVVFSTAVGFADAYQSYLSSYANSNGGSATTAFVRREAVPAGAAGVLSNIDFSTALPLITNATVTAAVPARPDITITAAGSVASTDGGAVRLIWYRDGGAGPSSSGAWTFIVPPGTTAIKAPALPANAAAFILQSGDQLNVEDAAFVEATQLPGYSALKTLPVTPSSGLSVATESTPLPAAGTVRVTRRRLNQG